MTLTSSNSVIITRSILSHFYTHTIVLRGKFGDRHLSLPLPFSISLLRLQWDPSPFRQPCRKLSLMLNIQLCSPHGWMRFPDLALVFSVAFVLVFSQTQCIALVGTACSCILSVLLRPEEVTEQQGQVHCTFFAWAVGTNCFWPRVSRDAQTCISSFVLCWDHGGDRKPGLW